MSKVILITGTSSGFGKSIAEKLHSQGYTVIGTSRNADKINSPFKTMKLDINNYEMSKNLIDNIINSYGKIDILINNAGINITGPIETANMSDIKKVFDTNFFSHVNMIQKVLPNMRSNYKGLIINITSIAGYLGLPYWGTYCASKSSFNIIAESLNIELKKYNVDVVNISPGDYKTEISLNRVDKLESTSPYYNEYKNVINSVNSKMKHGRDPNEVAELVSKIINEKNPKINYLVGGFLEKKNHFEKFTFRQNFSKNNNETILLNKMKFFIDTANLDQIKEAQDMGILDGVTTNPSLMAKEGITGEKNIIDHYLKICDIVDGDVSAEVISVNYEGIIKEGEALASLHKQIVIKVPMIEEGVKAIRYFSDKGLKTNCTLIFSSGQALLAAKAGATYVSPFIGRLDDISTDGLDLISDIRDIFDNYTYDTEILAASIRHSMHIIDCAKIGADVITSPLSAIKGLLKHPLTDIGLAKFLSDHKKGN